MPDYKYPSDLLCKISERTILRPSAVIDASIKIHRELGPGLLKSVYEVVLARDLSRLGFSMERQKTVAFDYV